MRMYDIIRKKRDGGALSTAEIDFFVRGYTNGEIPDYQASALCMAIWFRGMTVEETTALTLAIRDSGEILSLPHFEGLRVDKHSTGGVGDKTSLVIAPIVAALGIKVAKMSGRGLGHTGGTVDKLESFSGLRTDLSLGEFSEIVDRTGISIVGQSQDLAPADKLLYALRDVTATVDSMPLIASSIMGKKLAADDDCILLDVKTGDGAFMKTREDSLALARLMVEIGKRAGKRMRALITDMDAPLGYAVGNTLEVIEAIETLRGEGPEDLTELSVTLAAHLGELAGLGDLGHCEREVRRVIASGEALGKLADMVGVQGGDPSWVYDTEQFPRAKYTRTVCAKTAGYIEEMRAESVGVASLLLGAGRSTKTDVIDLSAGILLCAKVGDRVEEGQPIATLYTSDAARLTVAEEKFLESVEIGDTAPEKRPLIWDTVE